MLIARSKQIGICFAASIACGPSEENEDFSVDESKLEQGASSEASAGSDAPTQTGTSSEPNEDAEPTEDGNRDGSDSTQESGADGGESSDEPEAGTSDSSTEESVPDFPDLPEHPDLPGSPDDEPVSFIWITNQSDGTVSKVATRTMEERGRYLVAPEDELAIRSFSWCFRGRCGHWIGWWYHKDPCVTTSLRGQR